MAETRTRSSSSVSSECELDKASTANAPVFMRRALELSLQGRCSAPPNPWVGCVIVKHGQVLSEGWHRRRGERHAEANAFHDLSIEASQDADLYVTLEPCSHYGLTPPCCEAIASRGIRSVFIGITDPDTKVAGRGIKFLISKGIKVFSGILEDEIRESLRAYIHHRICDRPFVVGKIACSLNGSIACLDGTSQWITGTEARADSHKLRRESQAVLVGVNTVLSDDPQLTFRLNDDVHTVHQPLRVVIDPKGRCLNRSSLKIFDTSDAETLIIVEGDETKISTPQPSVHVQVMRLKTIQLDAILKALADRGILQVFVEGGAVTLSKFLDENLVNELVIYQAPKLFPGRNFLGDMTSPSTIKDVLSWNMKEFHKLGNDIKLVLTPNKR